MRFLATNLCTESATSRTASSSHVNFPVSNLANPLRSKRWRSSGTFVIDATNNKINFKESGGGSELTATITSGTYSVTTLKAEIKTRMDAVGASDYTVTYSTTTGLWTITSNGAYFALLNNTGTNQAAALFKVSLGFPNTDKTGALTYTGSTIAIHTLESIVFDFQTAQDINSVVLLWPREDGIKISSSAVIKIQANATDTWASPAVDQALSIDSDFSVASHFFSSNQSYRYWRITIQDPTNPYLYVELGMSWIGESLSFNEAENGFKWGYDDPSKVTENEFGHSYVDEYPIRKTLNFSYSFIQYATAKVLETAYLLNGNKKPVLVALDQSASVFDKDHFLIYGMLGKSFDLGHVSYDLFKGGFKITELG